MDTLIFIQNMAVILVAVGIVSVFFAKLGWPRAIGYILAGVLLGQYTWGGSLITTNAQETVDVLGQMGVLFLMFTLGLEFSLPKLKSVGGVALPCAIIDVVMMVWAGHFVATRFFGMGDAAGLFLGVAICDSATSVLAKTIGDLGWGGRRFTGFVMGITMVEDLLCVGLIAMLTGVARNHGAVDLKLVGLSMGGLVLFLLCVVLFGLLIVPRTVNWVWKLRDDESLLLTILGFCFLVAFVAIKLEYGIAMGAFLVGMVCAQADGVKRIYRQSVALRSMFSAIFFVTIGLQIDPSQLWAYRWQILALSGVVVVGKTLNCAVGSLLTGQSVKEAVQTGMGLAQIGEFALIIAFLGVSLHVFDAKSMFYPVVVGVSLLTTILNAALIRASDGVGDFLEAKLPRKWIDAVETYSAWVRRYREEKQSGKNATAIRNAFWLCMIQLALVCAIFISAGMLLHADFMQKLPDVFKGHERVLMWVAALLLSVPGYVFFFYQARRLGEAIGEFLTSSMLKGTRFELPTKRVFTSIVTIAFMVILFALVALLSNTFLPDDPFEKWLIILFIVVIGIVGWKSFGKMGGDALEALSAALASEKGSDTAEAVSVVDLLDIHTERVTVGMNAKVCGKSLRELNLRAATGASIIGIERAGQSIVNPTADEKLLYGDRALVLGDDDQIEKMRHLLA